LLAQRESKSREKGSTRKEGLIKRRLVEELNLESEGVGGERSEDQGEGEVRRRGYWRGRRAGRARVKVQEVRGGEETSSTFQQGGELEEVKWS